MLPITNFILLSAVIFVIGAAGVFFKRNIITILLCIELMLNAVNLTFVSLSKSMGTLDGQIAVFFVMVVAAAEAAVGLAIIIALYRSRKSVNTTSANELQG